MNVWRIWLKVGEMGMLFIQIFLAQITTHRSTKLFVTENVEIKYTHAFWLGTLTVNSPHVEQQVSRHMRYEFYSVLWVNAIWSKGVERMFI